MDRENYIIDELKNRIMEEEMAKQLEKILKVDFSFIPGANSRLMIIKDLVQRKNKLNEVLALLGNDYREIFKLIIIKGDIDHRLEELKTKNNN